MSAAYVIDTDKPTKGPWRETPFGNRYASVTYTDGRKFFVGVEKTKMVRIPYKPRGQNRGWQWVGFVNDANGKRIADADVNGSIGVRGLLIMAGLLNAALAGKGKPMYQVLVGNIGTVYTGKDRSEADRLFAVYVEQSQSLRGRAGGEPVTLFEDNEIIREHEGEVRDE
jgi:hypothetical protein